MLEGEGVDRRQFVGMQLPDGMFDSVVALVRRLEEHAVFLAVLDGTLPGVDALDPGNLGAGGEPGLDQRLRHGPRRLALALGLAQAQGVAIASLEPDSPAAKAGLQPGNIVLALDGERVTGADDLVRLLSGDRIGADTTLSVIAGSELKQFVVVPAERTEGQGKEGGK